MNKPNPEYVEAPYEVVMWTPATGELVKKEISRKVTTAGIEILVEVRNWKGVIGTELVTLPPFRPEEWSS